MCTRVNFMSHLSGPLGKEILETKRFVIDDPTKTYLLKSKQIQISSTHLKNFNLLSSKLIVLASMVCSFHTPFQSHPTDDRDYGDDCDDGDDDAKLPTPQRPKDQLDSCRSLSNFV